MTHRPGLSRRQALAAGGSLLAGTCARALGAPASAPATQHAANPGTKPISGSWISIQHPNAHEAVLWDPACAAFTARDWEDSVHEVASLGFEYLVLLSVAHDFRAYYPSKVFPRKELACEDPIEAMLRAADTCGIRFFVGCGWFGNWADSASRTDPEVTRRRLTAMGELAERYAAHQSFHGWYWPSEAAINSTFGHDALTYVNTCSREAGRLTPGKPTMIAPYGTRLAKPDDAYVRQLEAMDVDIVAYQDEVGVRKTRPDELPRIYEGLRAAHDRVPQRALWADVEVFTFAGDVYKSALVPAPWERVERQLTGVSPYVDRVLIYQYQGLMNRPGSRVAIGRADSELLYGDYRRWLRRHHPELLQKERGRDGETKEKPPR